MTLYIIRDWNEHFECAQSRKIKGPMTWVSIPCKHDGLGFRRIMALSDGPAVYGTWVLIVEVAAKCKVRGVLADERGPLTSEELAFKTGCPQQNFDRALEILTSERVGWIVVDESHSATSTLPTQDPTLPNPTKPDQTDTSIDIDVDHRLLGWIDWWNDLKREGAVAAGVSREPPSEAVRAGWKRVEKSKELRRLLGDRDALAEKIRESDFLKEGWFTLEKLLGGKNRDRAYYVQRILDDGYRNQTWKSNGSKQQSAGKQYDPNAKGDL